MDQQGICISSSIFYHLLQGCIDKRNLAVGREVHVLIIKSGLQSTAFLGNHLIRMYDSCGSLSEANQVFSKLPEPDVFVWTAIILSNAKLGNFEEAFKLYYQMHQSTVKPDGHVFVAIIKACAGSSALKEGKLIHAHIKESGFESDVFVGSALVDMYAKCGSLDDSRTVFDKILRRNVVTWSMMITGYAHHGLCWEALQLFQQMKMDGMEPDQVTYVSILTACAGAMVLEQGKLIHARLIKIGFQLDISLSNCLITMYAKCGSLENSRRVFEKLPKRNLLTWSAMIAGYIQHGCGRKALELFHQMQLRGIEPDQVTFVSILKGCSGIPALNQGQLIHANLIENGLESEVSIGNTLIDMYAKCESLEDASKVFDRLPKRDAITWTVMIAGCTWHEHGHKALHLFQKMLQGGLRPDKVIYLSLLKVCSSIGALDYGKLIHACTVESGFESYTSIGNTLIDLYIKCGGFGDACRLFDRLPKRDVVTWNAMIAGFSQCSNYKLARQYFEDMQGEGLKPDDVTYVNLLSACCRMGFLDEARSHFIAMKEDHGIAPTADHCNCMADLLGRVGHVDEAEDALQMVSSTSNVVGWTSLLSHCKNHSNVELGKRCFDHVVTMDRKKSIGYVLMANIYINAGMLEDADTVEELRQCANAWKKPGNALIEVDNKVHEFFVGDMAHLQICDINTKLRKLNMQMQASGYWPCLDLILQPLSDDENQDAL